MIRNENPEAFDNEVDQIFEERLNKYRPNKTQTRLAVFRRVNQLEKDIQDSLLRLMDKTGDQLTEEQERCYQQKFALIERLTIWAACRYQREKNIK